MGFRVKDKRVQRMLRDTPESLERWLRKAFHQHGEVYRREMGKRFGAKLSNGRNPTQNRLASRTGRLHSTIGYTVSGRDLRSLKLTYHIGSRDTIKYAVTQEEGRVIMGRPWLAVPLPAALTPTGRPRIESPGLVRGQPGWFLTKTEKGTLLIGKKNGDSVEWWWVLKPRVEIPARLGFERTVRGTRLNKDRLTRLRNAITRAVQEVT